MLKCAILLKMCKENKLYKTQTSKVTMFNNIHIYGYYSNDLNLIRSCRNVRFKSFRQLADDVDRLCGKSSRKLLTIKNVKQTFVCLLQTRQINAQQTSQLIPTSVLVFRNIAISVLFRFQTCHAVIHLSHIKFR